MIVWLHTARAADGWQSPPEEIVRALEGSVLPEWSPLPGGDVVELRPVAYPPLSELARPMEPLAGVRVDVGRRSPYRERLYVEPAWIDRRGVRTAIDLPEGRVARSFTTNADGSRSVFQLVADDGVELWVWDERTLRQIGQVHPNAILGSTWSWMPDQRSLLVKLTTDRAVPAGSAVPPGPETRSARAAKASSTYEARDLLTDAADDAAFEAFATSQLAVIDVTSGAVRPLGAPGVFGDVQPSPDGAYVLVERLKAPWSHRVIWSQFARDFEVWTADGALAHTVASLPAAEEVPIHGVPVGVRDIGWQESAAATLVWLEAQDQGDWSVTVPHRDVIRASSAPFDAAPRELYRGVHRVEGVWWGADGLFVVQEYERARRWRHVLLADADDGAASARPWFDLSQNDRYADPGNPVVQRNADGRALLVQAGADVFFSGTGASPEGDRPFLDRRSTADGKVVRLYRSPTDVAARFRGFPDPRKTDRFWVQSESPTAPPNLYEADAPKKAKAAAGEAAFTWKLRPLTALVDPVPELRAIHKEIVTYTRADGVPLSFTLYTPAGWKAGDPPLPTVVHAYPREFSDPATAGQISGSENTFFRLGGPTPVSFALHGYAVLDNTTMPVLGDPDTAYDTFVEQLVSSAQAAIDEAVRRGVTDRDRVGVTGHSHGGLMTATLLAHSDLFKAGIARSGAYNHTIRPFGFQSERRTLWAAKETYLSLSPVMFAPQINEPVLLLHGARDENPGTIPFQSERLFEAIRGSGGTAKWISLPYEGHGYLARESVHHVLAEQFAWFDTYVRDMTAP